jgi:hypothetical protein
VFLQPQWLVDVMKALVHHDLKGRLDAVGAGTAEANVTSLGAEFLHTGTLDRRLLVSGCFLPRAKAVDLTGIHLCDTSLAAGLFWSRS